MTTPSYHIIDEEKVKTIYFNQLTFGGIDNTNCIELKNIEYCFDENVDLAEIKIVDKSKKGYIMTKEGFMEWNPPYIERLNGEKEFLSFSKNERTPILYYYSGITPVCLSYICVKKPKNVIQINAKDFWSSPDSIIYENENKLIFDFGESIGWEISVSVREYTIDLIRMRDVYKFILTRGTCFEFGEEIVNICY